MTKPIDLTGHTYGRLGVISSTGRSQDGHRTWYCVCSCGVEVEARGNAMRSGNTRSCGCLGTDHITTLNKTHGLSDHPAYVSYNGARSRCTNPNQKQWRNYGGRGIEFRLPPFAAFWEAMGGTWFEGASLDRWPDTDGHYELGNVRWATTKEQARNRTDNVVVEFNGATRVLSDWAKDMGLHNGHLKWRIEKWGLERALTTPRTPRNDNKVIEFGGRTLPVSAWAEEMQISKDTLRHRLKDMALEDALDPSKLRRRSKKLKGDSNVILSTKPDPDGS